MRITKVEPILTGWLADSPRKALIEEFIGLFKQSKQA